MLNKAFKSCQRLFKFCFSGEISPNLVTLTNDVNKNALKVHFLHLINCFTQTYLGEKNYLVSSIHYPLE